MRKDDPVTISGETKTAYEWSVLRKVSWEAALTRVNTHGWSVERAVSEPLHSKSTAGKNGKKRSSWRGQSFCKPSFSRKPLQ